MRQRGPDEFDFYLEENKEVFIAHSRLAIQGIKANVKQPFKCIDGSMLAYNGEIYNMDEISKNSEINECDTPIFSNCSRV